MHINIYVNIYVNIYNLYVDFFYIQILNCSNSKYYFIVGKILFDSVKCIPMLEVYSLELS